MLEEHTLQNPGCLQQQVHNEPGSPLGSSLMYPMPPADWGMLGRAIGKGKKALKVGKQRRSLRATLLLLPMICRARSPAHAHPCTPFNAGG